MDTTFVKWVESLAADEDETSGDGAKAAQQVKMQAGPLPFFPTMNDFTNHFMMYTFKVQRCYRNHSWYKCPYAHPHEPLSRRPPHATPCAVQCTHRALCSGFNCRFAHNQYEMWLHPSRYRTVRCKKHKCNRKLCFFAHSESAVRDVAAEALRVVNVDGTTWSRYNHLCGAPQHKYKEHDKKQ